MLGEHRRGGAGGQRDGGVRLDQLGRTRGDRGLLGALPGRFRREAGLVGGRRAEHGRSTVDLRDEAAVGQGFQVAAYRHVGEDELGVVHEPCGSMRTVNVSPRSSMRAGWLVEMVVRRRRVSRSYPNERRPSSTRVVYLRFLASASLTSKRSAKSHSTSIRTVSSAGFSSWLRTVSSSRNPSARARCRITERLAST